ncbi:GNAT family N-acetyltransferase [Paenibacillus hamazuiensis]|uniref:GNAT family N-acetyltransferase n=1 Tax=Paenibacillus hamazuiensis TaxID=2936508 RepID=UPI00200C0B93|nr:GNAT family N-acetyltransferase [Paenibacillus hamazuiensis]
MNSITIRPATKKDVPFLWEMLYESIHVAEGKEKPDRNIVFHPSIAKYLENWGREGDFALVAVNESGEPVGSITLRFFKQADKGYGYVNDETPELGMAILPAYRGQGIGTALMKALVEYGRAAGIQAISLSVDPSNPAMSLYKRTGFKEVGIEGTSITMLLLLQA